ncbi:SWIM zinc finger family protein [Streptomonospora wellingtoniae]|uniref:SWIM zinc finger family protein n=1 Tax=Streptomonospora wellingtoniae TaxID=3075544 RepID=A0ABU2KTP2_9ACTN|nr:SWIM zinc finger family protein [Streptomonospora sp. DSM 45055]MDT0302613.1 SWIM zinc finger family protein [Streptomonospora sp. DSM 45055]
MTAARGRAEWVAHRLREAVERDGDPARLERGRGYADRGAVSAVKVRPGEATARVQGSRARPYLVSVIIPVLAPGEWAALAGALGTQPVFRAALLAGAFPQELERVFGVMGLRLLPSGLNDLVLSCSCPDWGDPCKHAAAAVYALAETLAAKPLLLVEWRGRPRGELLADLRRHARTPALPEDPAAACAEPEPPGVADPEPLRGPGDFWRAPALPEPPGPDATRPATGLAEPPPAAGGGSGPDEGTDDLVALLAPLYERMARSPGRERDGR